MWSKTSLTLGELQVVNGSYVFELDANEGGKKPRPLDLLDSQIFLDPADDVAMKISKQKGPKSTRNSLSIYTTKSPKALQRNLKSMGISNKVNLFSYFSQLMPIRVKSTVIAK